jgi:adenylosuccinate lyase
MEDVPLWHERDISHSSVERIVMPDAFGLLDYLLHAARELVEGLVVHPDRMGAVLRQSHGLIYSQRVLLRLVEAGLTREEAYAVVQENAMRAWDEERDLLELLRADRRVHDALDPGELVALFDPGWYTRHVGSVMERVAAL